MIDEIRKITEDILEDYKKGRYIDRENRFNQPDRDAVAGILSNLQHLIYPGFYRAQTYRYYTRENATSTLVEDTLFNLTKQIGLVYEYCEGEDCPSEEENTLRAREAALAFLSKIPEIRALIDTDLQAEFDGDPAAFNKDEIIYSYPGLYAIMV